MNIGLEEIRTAVSQVIAEVPAGKTYHELVYSHPDFDAGKCTYLVYGRPACLIARALSKLGVPNQVLARLDKGTDGFGQYTGIAIVSPLLAESGFELSKEAQEFAKEVQREQDWGIAWSEIDV